MKLRRLARAVAIEPRATVSAVRNLRTFRSDRRTFIEQARTSDTNWRMGEDWPCLNDRFDAAGVANGQYFHQDLYVAQAIFAAEPSRHVDAGSRVDGFVGHVAAFMAIEVLDIRDLRTTASNIRFTQRDLMEEDAKFDNYTDSLSCLHTLEHFGLGRYGDPVSVDGYLKGWSNLCRMVRPGGLFYFSVPVSRRERVEFNAHRLFGLPRLLEMIEPEFEVRSLAAVGDDLQLVEDLDPYSVDGSRTFDIEYGCCIFTLQKRGGVSRD